MSRISNEDIEDLIKSVDLIKRSVSDVDLLKKLDRLRAECDFYTSAIWEIKNILEFLNNKLPTLNFIFNEHRTLYRSGAESININTKKFFYYTESLGEFLDYFQKWDAFSKRMKDLTKIEESLYLLKKENKGEA